MEVDQETAIARFLSLARLCHERRLTAVEVIHQIIHFYQEVRIFTADLDKDDDMLLFQWGASRNLLFAEPTDLRPLKDGKLEFDDVESAFLEFTRQVFAPGDDEEAEFDDLAIHMSIILLYGPASGQEQGGQLRISLKRADDDVKEFVSQPFVSERLHADPTRYVSLVGFCG
ncbi:MAG: hypothetical protein HY913_08810 [Desulfomonile tiedjei]|nr:hypothetical protein [Desulfomonile tiedjei]